ncbi:MAG TPA: tyrosine-type recombinase/integrase [Capsulimonadaceae bacterium]|jgi:integrase
MANQLTLLDQFLQEQANANRSPHTIRAYRSDLGAYNGEPTADSLRAYFASINHLAPATRSRKQAAFSAYFAWLVQQGAIPSSPMEMLQRVSLEPPPPRGITREQFNAILAQVKSNRDRLLYRMLFELGLRISEALAIRIEDLDLTRDDEHVSVLGKGNRIRTLLLDDATLVRELRAHIRVNGYKHGLVFRATKNGTGLPLRYQSVQERWQSACRKAGLDATLHQCRHGHATELINSAANNGAPISLATIRKRLGHRQIASTMRYAELSDESADSELRARRRRMKG